jgi:hypothetical protein
MRSLRCRRFAHSLKVSTNQRRDVSVSLRDGSEHQSSSVGGLDVADADLRVTFAFFAAADEGRVQADSDGRYRDCWLIRRRIVELLTDPQGMAAQCLRNLPASIGSRCARTSAATR